MPQVIVDPRDAEDIENILCIASDLEEIHALLRWAAGESANIERDPDYWQVIPVEGAVYPVSC